VNSWIRHGWPEWAVRGVFMAAATSPGPDVVRHSRCTPAYAIRLVRYADTSIRGRGEMGHAVGHAAAIGRSAGWHAAPGRVDAVTRGHVLEFLLDRAEDGRAAAAAGPHFGGDVTPSGHRAGILEEMRRG
jgi:hypothetical protein